MICTTLLLFAVSPGCAQGGAAKKSYTVLSGDASDLRARFNADQGKVRNHAVGLVSAGHVAFLDGDDLWSENWLVDAYRMCADDDRVIGHPELNWFFENQQNLYFLPIGRDAGKVTSVTRGTHMLAVSDISKQGVAVGTLTSSSGGRS